MRVTPGSDAEGGVRCALRARLAALGAPLQILAEGLLGEDEDRIEWLAVEPAGRLWVVLVDESGADDRLLVRGLAQRAWVRARLSDWQQLAPELPARPDPPPLLVLLAPSFSRLLRAAAHEAGADGGIRLGRYHWQPGPHSHAELRLEPVPELESTRPRIPARPVPAPLAAGFQLASEFKSGLSDRDFVGLAGSPDALRPGGSDDSRPADDNS